MAQADSIGSNGTQLGLSVNFRSLFLVAEVNDLVVLGF